MALGFGEILDYENGLGWVIVSNLALYLNFELRLMVMFWYLELG